MAIIDLSSPFSSYRGKINESVVVYPRSERQVSRVWVSPANPNTDPQSDIRSFMTQSAQAFSGITNEQREAWEVFSRLMPRKDKDGNDYVQTALGAYVGVNVMRLARSLSIDSDPPEPTIQPAITGLTDVSLETSTGTVRFTIEKEITDGFVFLQSTRPLGSAQRNPRLNDYARMLNSFPLSTIAIGAGSTLPVAFNNSLLQNPFVVGDWIGIRVTSYNTGFAKGLAFDAKFQIPEF